jgi:AraC-like DNA-binding protein/ligand-binding sensor protein
MVLESDAPPAVRSGDFDRKNRLALVARLAASDVFRVYQHAFESITGLPLALRAVGSFQTPLDGAERINPLCKLLASRNKTCAACLATQARLENSSLDGEVSTTCYAGLRESAIPVRVGGHVIAYLQTGQVLFRTPTEAETELAAARLAAMEPGLEASAIRAAIHNTRVVTKSFYADVLQMLGLFAHQLASLCNQVMVAQAHAEAPAITRVRAYVSEHLAEDIALKEVARIVGMSPHYFCKYFHRHAGVPFTQFVARLRVEWVKNLLLDPHKRVSEAAFEAGFQSLSQFNRVFNRYEGQAPTAYRGSLQRTQAA